ncbi:unnamed protein product [Adineta steineri]|uniref:Uncharacterized protein n=1 Tax=Adineta steineri TaxID=433720 RepID=A0A813TCA7_9BILA|nr:unnamed protein product [Adineta steineri]CAF0920568.1 unnamed protein product [Adineta steineri]
MVNNVVPVALPQRSNKMRMLIILNVFLFSCLFLTKFDFNLPRTMFQGILNPSVNYNKSNTTIASITKNNTIPIIDKKINVLNNSKIIGNSSTSDQPKEAFVTFCNNERSYLALLNVLLDSIHAFSTRPIIAFGIDVDLNVDTKKYPRLIKRRISQRDCGPSVFFCKIHAIVSSNLDYGVLMETDDVVNYNVDLLFDVLHVWPHPVPISPRHPDDPQNYFGFMNTFNVSRRTTHYIHAHMIWNYHAMPFLRNLRSLLRAGNFRGANWDETAVNVMLWKAGADHTLCKYDPYFTYVDTYERWPNITNCSQYCHTVFLTLHGSKDAEVSASLLKRLIKLKGTPTLQTRGMGGLYHVNDTKVTCCYPDTEPSPLHPLLCKHPPA